MGILDDLKNKVIQQVNSLNLTPEAKRILREETDKAAKNLKKAFTTTEKTFRFDYIPTTLEEFMALPNTDMKNEYAVPALTVMALNAYELAPEECHKMMEYLNGPDELTNSNKLFIEDRFMDHNGYKVRSYFKGASPENNYKPNHPYTITVSNSAHSRIDDNYLELYVKCYGADNDRKVRLRHKPSTDQWFIVSYDGLLADVQTPAEKDPWA